MKACDAPRCGWDTDTPFVGKSNPFVCHKVWQNTCALLKTPFSRKLPVFFSERVLANPRFLKKPRVDKKLRLMSGTAKNTAICGVL